MKEEQRDMIIGVSFILIISMLTNLGIGWLFKIHQPFFYTYGVLSLLLNIWVVIKSFIITPQQNTDD